MTQHVDHQNPDHDRMRLDRWLWAARFFKTRGNAATAVSGGKVHVNGARVKPAKGVGIGDVLRIRRDQFEFTITITGLSNRRGPAAAAQALYQESDASRQQRTQVAEEKRAARALGAQRARKPDKKSRRELLRAKRER